ncbi:Abi-alpha family protein [Helicobacter pametensis]|uniref:Abi-alpha family protein n=1 Tax=Helicobacter pametensis TaxID=95149 RepID=UPI000482F29B|nr:Abi-alpha family protein [Helicobacter pametensis]
MGFNIDIKFDANEVYHDTLQPALKEVGKGLEDVAKTANLILAPLTLCGAYGVRFRKWCKRIENEIDEKNIQEAQPNILLPTLAGLTINPDETLLGEMFFNILKGSIDKTKQKFLSPAFPKILEQLSKDEAVMLVLLKKKNHSLEIWEHDTIEDEEEILIDVKTKALFFDSGTPCRQEIKYNECKNEKLDFQDRFYFYCDHLSTLNLIECIEIDRKRNDRLLIRYAQLRLTQFGQKFSHACISPKCEEYI